MHQSSLSNQKRIEQEMLHAVLMDQATYPWDPAEVTMTSYLNCLETAVESKAEAVEKPWECLTKQARKLWAA